MSFSKKFIYFLITISILSLLLTSCSYNNTKLNKGSVFNPTWDFSNSETFNYNENYVEIKDGSAQLKPQDLSQSSNDFNSGTYSGTLLQNDHISLQPQNPESYTIQDILPERTNDLLAYWNLNENSLSTSPLADYQDSSGNNHGANRIGTFSFTSDGQVGNASQFDGATNYITISNPIINNSSELSVSCWFYIDDITTFDEAGFGTRNGCIADWNSWSPGNQEGFNLGVFSSSSGFISFQWNIGDGVNFASTTKTYSEADFINQFTNKWVHYVGTFANGNLKIYVNGVLLNTSTTGSATSYVAQTSTPIFIGRSGINPGQIQGKIDEVGIWQKELSDNEVKKLFYMQYANFNEFDISWTPNYNNLVGYWKMDGNWQDSSGQSHDGTRVGTGDSSPSFGATQGMVGTTYGEFDGVDDAVLMGSLSQSGNTEYSLSGWLKIDFSTVVSSDYIFGIQDSAQGQRYTFSTVALSAGLVHYIAGSTGQWVYSSALSETPSNEWFHYVLTWSEENGASVYINGESSNISLVSLGSGNLRSGGNFSIGIDEADLSRDYNGDIDEAAVWSVELSPSDVSTIYHRQKQKYAGHYESKVFDSGGLDFKWLHLSWLTDFPFGKSLIGDFNNDGTPDNESTTDYPYIVQNLSDGLVGYWNFNESVYNSAPGGLDFADISGNNNHGSEVSGVSIAKQGITGNSVRLGSSSDYISIPHSSSFDFGTDNFSVSGWVNTSETQGTIFATSNSLAGANFTLFANHNTPATPRAFLSNGSLFCTVDASLPINDGKWHYLSFVFKRGPNCNTDEIEIYIDGVLDTNRTLNNAGAGASNFDITNSNDLWFGRRFSGGNQFFGQLDEIAIWNRALNANEIQQLYRRGANRIKFQVKSCVDALCECKSYNTNPQGNANDCDGDSLTNDLDFNDPHKAEYLGPGGNGTTYYSEAFNRKGTDTLFNCANNTSDSNGNICVRDEITLNAGPKPTSPIINYNLLPLQARPINNRYFKYKALFEADENSSCNSSPCLPELTSIDLNPNRGDLFYGQIQELVTIHPFKYKNINSISVKADDCVSFQLSPNGNDYYYVQQGTWTPVSTEFDRTSASDLKNNIIKFSEQFGPGSVFLKAFLSSNENQTAQCKIQSIKIL